MPTFCQMARSSRPAWSICPGLCATEARLTAAVRELYTGDNTSPPAEDLTVSKSGPAGRSCSPAQIPKTIDSAQMESALRCVSTWAREAAGRDLMERRIASRIRVIPSSAIWVTAATTAAYAGTWHLLETSRFTPRRSCAAPATRATCLAGWICISPWLKATAPPQLTIPTPIERPAVQ